MVEIYDICRFLKHICWSWWYRPLYKILHIIPYYKKELEVCKKNYDILRSFVDVRKLNPANGILRKIQLDNLKFAKELICKCEELDIKPFMIYGTLLGAERHKGFIPWDDDLDFGLVRDDYEKLIDFASKKHIIAYRKMNRIFPKHGETIEQRKELLKKHPNELIFILSSDLIKVIKGTDINSYVQCDFFPFDYYTEKYKYDDFVNQQKKINKQLWKISDGYKEVEFLKAERLNNKNIVKFGSKIFYGNDNLVARNFKVLELNNDFIATSDLSPLKKMHFEDTEFLAPNNHINILNKYFGNNWCEIPDNIIPPHITERE